jgi:hypothetical protein
MRCRPTLAAAVAVFATVFPSLHAQDQDPEPPPPNLYTLNVYANLMQFPTIVLSQDLQPIPPVPLEKFAIKLDGGPVFHPTKMRIEGDDAISLAVLLDAGGGQNDVMEAFARSFPQLVPSQFHPQDKISVYAIDCAVVRSLKPVPAVNAETINKGIADALIAPGLHGNKTKAACGYELHLWDAIAQVAQDLGDSAGRRVILVVSGGRERDSKTSFAAANMFVGSKGVAIFGLRDSQAYERDLALQSDDGLKRTWGNPAIDSTREDLFAQICANNGGTVLNYDPRSTMVDLRHFIDILRARYILEFPRPEDKTAAHHRLDIYIPGSTAMVRSTGGWAPIPNPSILADPSTVPTAPSPAKIGTRHPLDPKS